MTDFHASRFLNLDSAVEGEAKSEAQAFRANAMGLCL